MRGSQREGSAPFKLQPGAWVREFPGLRARARRQGAPFKGAPGPSAPSQGANSPNRDVLDALSRKTLPAAKAALGAAKTPKAFRTPSLLPPPKPDRSCARGSHLGDVLTS